MAASTFTVTGTYTLPSGAPAPTSSTVTFRASNQREVNTNTIQDAITITTNLNASGVLSQVLVVNVGGYTVTENVAGSSPVSYTIPGLANIDLSSVDASLAQFDASDVVNVVPGENVTGTTYTWVLSDGADKMKRFTNGSAVTTTIDGSAAIPVGTVFNGMQLGAGRVTVVGINNAVIHGASGAVTTRVQYSPLSIRKDTATVWIVTGDLS